MADDLPVRDPTRQAVPPRPRPSNWASSLGTETVVPWVVTVDLQALEAAATDQQPPEQPRITTPEDQDWMTGCYYF